jgi:hypothetical protein
VSDEDALAAIERELDAAQWNIDLLVGVMARLVAQRNHLRAKEAKARARELKRARQYCGAGVVEVMG